MLKTNCIRIFRSVWIQMHTCKMHKTCFEMLGQKIQSKFPQKHFSKCPFFLFPSPPSPTFSLSSVLDYFPLSPPLPLPRLTTTLQVCWITFPPFPLLTFSSSPGYGLFCCFVNFCFVFRFVIFCFVPAKPPRLSDQMSGYR